MPQEGKYSRPPYRVTSSYDPHPLAEESTVGEVSASLRREHENRIAFSEMHAGSCPSFPLLPTLSHPKPSFGPPSLGTRRPHWRPGSVNSAEKDFWPVQCLFCADHHAEEKVSTLPSLFTRLGAPKGPQCESTRGQGLNKALHRVVAGD